MSTYLIKRTIIKRCAVEGCDRKSRCRGYCTMHHSRWKRHGDPSVNKQWKGDEGRYRAVHSRLRSRRGRASEHMCPCGAAAQDWAYSHRCPNEKTDLVDGKWMPYSTDLTQYEPLCRACHFAFDGARCG